MKREDEWLREACGLLAQEETEQLEKSLNRKTTQEAEALFQRHKRQALKLIARNSKKRHGFGIALRSAACLALMAGAVWLALSQQAKEPAPLAPVYTASVAPFVSSSPSPSVAKSPAPTAAPTRTPVPAWTPPPAETPEAPPQASPTISPVQGDNFSASPTPGETDVIFITPSPTETPAPTAVPSPSPTPSASAAPEADAYEEGLNGWGGNYYLGRLAADWQLLGLEQDAECRRVEYQVDGRSIAFTEYSTSRVVDVPAGAELSYIALGGNGIALKMKADGQVILAWEMGGQTLILEGEELLAERLAAGVEKISRP